jgi:DNA-binding Lrp family transcriptional regulator
MPARKIELDEPLIHRLYIVERLPLREIAKRLGCKGSAPVIYTLRKLGLQRPEKWHRSKRLVESEVVEGYRNGLSCSKIAVLFDVSQSCVRDVLKRRGIALRKSRIRACCKMPGCKLPPHLVWQHGVMTGTMCLAHRREYYAMRAKVWYRAKYNPKHLRKRKYPVSIT